MIVVENLYVRAGDFRLQGVSFDVPAGTYGMLMGRTGSGKTTLLEAIAGLKPILSGQIVLGDVDVTHLKAAERNIGYVPQDGALFPTMSVRDNLGFALTIRQVPKRQITRRVDELAKMLEISHLLGRSIQGLSGGEGQRVALGRALAFRPSILCLDEPLSALDQDTKTQIIELLKRVQLETGVTCLHVTHNHQDADALADVRLQLVDGKIRGMRNDGSARITGGSRAAGAVQLETTQAETTAQKQAHDSTELPNPPAPSDPVKPPDPVGEAPAS